MSVTFRIEGVDDCSAELNVSCANARDILSVLGLAPVSRDLWGTIEATELRARTARLLWPARAAMLAEASRRPQFTTQRLGRAIVVDLGREDTYLAERLSQLHAMADRACQSRGEGATIVFD